MGWIDDEGGEDYVRTSSSQADLDKWATQYFRYMVMPAPGAVWNLTDFDFDEDYKRFASGAQESLLSAANPDLRKFKRAGGKLLVYQGWNDQSDVAENMIDFYQLTERTMGGRTATADFFRLFLIPGMKHCSGGDGAYAIDYLAYLESWVEHGDAPNKLIGAHVDRNYLIEHSVVDGKLISAWMGAYLLRFPLEPGVPITFTRPIYPYPLRARYRGRGDPDMAENFGPN
jgi:feruloyl esterase